MLRSTRRWWLVSSEGTRRLEVSAVRRQGAGLVAKWAGCDSPEAAEALKGAQVAVARCDFPRLGKGEYYWVDLIGLRVINRSERELGTVKGLRPSAAHDLLEIEPGSVGEENSGGREILVPVVADFIDAIDLDAGIIRVNWEPEWLA